MYPFVDGKIRRASEIVLDAILDRWDFDRRGRKRKTNLFVRIAIFLGALLSTFYAFLAIFAISKISPAIRYVYFQYASPFSKLDEETIDGSKENPSALWMFFNVLAWSSVFAIFVAQGVAENIIRIGHVNDENSFLMQKFRKAFRAHPPARNFPLVSEVKFDEKDESCALPLLGGSSSERCLWIPNSPSCHVFARAMGRVIEDVKNFDSHKGQKTKFLIASYGTSAQAIPGKSIPGIGEMSFRYDHVHSLCYSENGVLYQSYVGDMDHYVPMCIDLKKLSKTFVRLSKIDETTGEISRKLHRPTVVIFETMKKKNTPLYEFLTCESDKKYEIEEYETKNAWETHSGIYRLLTTLNEWDYSLLCMPQSCQGDDEVFDGIENLMCCSVKVII